MNLNFIPLLLAANKYRLIDFDFPQIVPGWPLQPLIVLALIIVSIVIGVMFANAVRMPTYGWKLGLILSTILVSAFVVAFGEFKLGVDLKGGVILVYEVNETETATLRRNEQGETWKMSQLTAVISNRLNPTGLSEIVVRPFGPKQVEIVVPETDPGEIEKIKEKIRTGGVLQFMIVAGERDSELVELARQQSERPDRTKFNRDVLDQEGRQVGFWARLGRDKGDPSTAPFRSLDVIGNGYIRDSRTGDMIELRPEQKGQFANSQASFDAFLRERGTRDIDVLMVYDADAPIRGDDLAGVRADHDESLRPSIDFTMNRMAAPRMGYVTRENLHRKLAIIFDNTLLSAPVIQSQISDRGQITGNFTQEEVDFIVGILKSGSMPVIMEKEPISENEIGSILGFDTIVKGSWSVGVSLALVLAFTWAYYRFAGFIACCALILNLLLTIGIMVLLRAPLTLPGLAGLVLTVGMSVDSNVLIFERMREELTRGAGLRMAIRNGFDRAMVTIVDSNLTTLLTAFVLYFIGTDQVKGFGITLILGILTSMYTAIFCARTVFDIGERTRWLKTLRMTRFLTKTNVDWVKLFAPAAIASMIVIGVGLAATVARGKGLFDIDLVGGTSVTFILKQPTPVEVVREKLGAVLPQVVDKETNTRAQFTAYELSLSGGKEQQQTVFKVDCSLSDIDILKAKVREALKAPDGSDLLKTYHMEFGPLAESPADAPRPPPVITAPPASKAAKKSDTKKSDTQKPAETTQPPAQEPAPKEPAPKEPAEPNKPAGDEKPSSTPPVEQEKKAAPQEDSPGCSDDPPLNEQPPSEKSEPDTKTAAQPADKAGSDAPKPEGTPATTAAASASSETSTPVAPAKFKTQVTLTFPGSPISAQSLTDRISESAKASINQYLPDVAVASAKWDGQDNSAHEKWDVTLPIGKEQAQKVVEHMRADLESSVVWQTSSKIGGQVSADTRLKAVSAILISLLGIVAYMWFRFQKAVWGIAAVVALAHDTLVMLGGIAVSYWLVGLLGFAGVEEFKISLPVVAAFLTLIGYSVNDTIVIFDRLREIRGKSPGLTRQMLNDAVNLTMSRTILTSGTVFIVVVVLYFFGGPGIHAFAFSLVIGVISGTYSTVFIAAPLLLWMFSRGQAQEPVKLEKREVA